MPLNLKFAHSYERHKDRMREVSREKVYQGQDIWPVPEVVNPERKQKALDSLLSFCGYFPKRFSLPFSNDQLETIQESQYVVESGGKRRTVMPRGSGKTQISVTTVEWAIFSGRWKNVFLVGSNMRAANRMIDSIKKSLESNNLLLEDFPEICYPIRILGKATNKATGQHLAGAKTHIKWSAHEIVFPTIEGSLASGALLTVTGIFCSDLRGGFHTIPGTGEVIRPQGVVLDDVQNDGTAINPLRVDKLLGVINSTVLGMEGPDDALTILCPGTVLAPDDMISRLGDVDQFPDWSGKLYRMLYQFPDNVRMWEEYANMRAQGFRRGDKLAKEATQFYIDNRAEMDKGGVIAWEHRYRKKKGEVSAIQCAMNLYIDNPETFWKEYQNEPRIKEDLTEQLTRELILGRTNDLERCICPRWTKHLTGYIDVQLSLLYYAMVAWDDDFRGAVIDYGSWPDQNRAYWTLEDAPNKLYRWRPEDSDEGRIRKALEALIAVLVGRPWQRDGGGTVPIDKIGVDTGYKDDVVCEWSRNSIYTAQIVPMRGLGIKARNKPLSEYKRADPRERYGFHWRIVPNQKQGVRVFQADINFWKSFISARFRQPMREPGSLSVFGRLGTDHRMFADHCTSEICRPQIDEISQRRVEEWEPRPLGLTDNHLWDCLVNTAPLASYLGANPPNARPGKVTVDNSSRPSLQDLKNGMGRR